MGRNGPESSLALLPVQLGGIWCALDARHVEEILGAHRWISLAGASEQVPGVLGWRGMAVAVLDLGRLANLSEAIDPGRGEARMVVVRARGCTCAIPVEAAREVVEVGQGALRPPFATSQRFASLEVELDDGLVVPILDVEAALDSVLPAVGSET